MVVPLLFVFVFLLSHAISIVAAQLCLVLLLHSLPMLIFYGEWYRLVPFSPFLRLVGLPTAIFCRVNSLGFISLSFLSGFYGPLFLPLLTNLFLHPFLLVIGFFYCWASFIKNGVSTILKIIIIIIIIISSQERAIWLLCGSYVSLPCTIWFPFFVRRMVGSQI